MAGENLTQAVSETTDLFISTGHQLMEMGIVITLLMCIVATCVYVIRRQYLDGRADRADYLTSSKNTLEAFNNLARQQEIANAQKVSCLFKGS